MERVVTPNQVPTTLGPYRLLRSLGKGGMGEVYEAVAPDGTEVAVKCIRPTLENQPEIRRRFAREARAAAKLDHPNIVRLLDFGVDAGRSFMAMELVRGGTLADWRAAPPPASTLLEAFHQILLALGHAHARGIVHRDLKPENILLDHTEAGVIPKVMDFGVVHFRDEAAESERNQIIGTPAYMSPEQVMQLADVMPATDIYAIGVMLYELLVGRLPFSASSAAKMIVSVMNDPIPAVVLRDGYRSGQDWDAIMRRFLAKEPSERFVFAADARASLHGMDLSGAPVRQSDVASAGASAMETRGGPSTGHASFEFVSTVASTGASVPSPTSPLLRREDATGRTAPLQLFQLRDVHFHGREQELELLHDHLHDAVERAQGGITLIEGEIGIGKTRVLAQLREYVEESGMMQVWSAEYDGRPSSASVGLAMAVRRGLGVSTMEGGAIGARVAGELARLGSTDRWEHEALTELVTPRTTPLEAPKLSREESQWALIERTLRRACVLRPVLLILDDIHLSDGGVLRFLEYLVQARFERRPWHVVATYRPEHLRGNEAFAVAMERLEGLKGAPGFVRRIRLARLGLRTLQAVVRDALPLSPGIADVVAMRAGGNPMVAVELVRHLVDSGRLDASGTAPDPEELLHDLPIAVGALLRKRLEEADATHLEVWQSLAFLGLRFTLSLARALHGVADVGAQVQLDESLAAGLVAGVFVEEADDVFRLESALLREALLDRVAEVGAPADLERAAAEAKHAVLGDAAALDIARHLDRAGEVNAAYRSYVQAANDAAVGERYAQALEAYLAAEAMIDAGAPAGDAGRMHVLLGQAEAQLRLGAWEQADRAVAMTRRIAGLSRQGVPARATRLHGELARNKGDLREARPRFEAARAAAERTGDAIELAYATFGLGQLELRDGKLQHAEHRFRDAIERFAALELAAPAAAAMRELGRTAYATGLYEEALALGEAAHQRSLDASDRHGAALSRILTGEVAGALGDGRSATAQFEEARDALRAVGDRHGAGLAVLAMGNIARAQELPELARLHLEEAELVFREMGDQQHATIASLLLAALDAEDGRWDDAEPRIAHAIERDADERIDDPRFVSAIVDLARHAIFAGRADRARELLRMASWKLERIAHESPLYDRVDEVQYLSAELAEPTTESAGGVIDWLDDGPSVTRDPLPED